MITKEKIEFLQDLIKSKIKEIEDSHNVKIEFGRITYNSSSYNTTMNVTSNVQVEQIEEINTILSKKYGFIDNIIGMEFQVEMRTFVIKEFKQKNRLYPVIAISKTDSKPYKFSVEQIKRYLPQKLILRNRNIERLLNKNI